MDPTVIRIICAAIAVAFGILIFVRRRGRNIE